MTTRSLSFAWWASLCFGNLLAMGMHHFFLLGVWSRPWWVGCVFSLAKRFRTMSGNGKIWTVDKRSFRRCLVKWMLLPWLDPFSEDASCPLLARGRNLALFLSRSLCMRDWVFESDAVSLSEKADMWFLIGCYIEKWHEICLKINKKEDSTFTLFKIFIWFFSLFSRVINRRILIFNWKDFLLCVLLY